MTERVPPKIRFTFRIDEKGDRVVTAAQRVRIGSHVVLMKVTGDNEADAAENLGRNVGYQRDLVGRSTS